jgi:hypothetical protein
LNCISEIEQIDASRATDSSSGKKTDWLTIREEKVEEKVELPATFDDLFHP